MGADTPNEMEHTPGTNGSISVSGDDEAELRGYWDKLRDGGVVTLPLEKAPWGDSFGMCIDKYGVNWLVNINGTPALGARSAAEPPGRPVRIPARPRRATCRAATPARWGGAAGRPPSIRRTPPRRPATAAPSGPCARRARGCRRTGSRPRPAESSRAAISTRSRSLNPVPTRPTIAQQIAVPGPLVSGMPSSSAPIMPARCPLPGRQPPITTSWVRCSLELDPQSRAAPDRVRRLAFASPSPPPGRNWRLAASAAAQVAVEGRRHLHRGRFDVSAAPAHVAARRSCLDAAAARRAPAGRRRSSAPACAGRRPRTSIGSVSSMRVCNTPKSGRSGGVEGHDLAVEHRGCGCPTAAATGRRPARDTTP